MGRTGGVMPAAHTHTARDRSRRVPPGQLGLFDEPIGPVGTGAAADGASRVNGCPAARRGNGIEAIPETGSATPARGTRAKPPGRAGVPVSCVGCGRPHAGDTTRTCLCRSCVAIRSRKAAARTLREIEEAAAAWSAKRRAGNAGVAIGIEEVFG